MSKKRKQHHDDHIDESWLIPYADLLTLLLALFIILFASSQTDSKKYEQIMRSLNSAFTGGVSFFEAPSTKPPLLQPSGPSIPVTSDTEQVKEQQEDTADQIRKETEQLEQLKQKLDQYIRDNDLTAQLETKLNSDQLVITIRDHALFASGSASVKEDAQKLAVAIAAMLSEYPQYNIEVAGHTDNIPIHNKEFETNWELSAKRAINFMKILLHNKDVNAEKFRAIGYGEYRPIDTNDTIDGRARNRRVEVSILRTIKEGSVSVHP